MWLLFILAFFLLLMVAAIKILGLLTRVVLRILGLAPPWRLPQQLARPMVMGRGGSHDMGVGDYPRVKRSDEPATLPRRIPPTLNGVLVRCSFSRCQRVNPPTARFCARCGHVLEVNRSDAPGWKPGLLE